MVLELPHCVRAGQTLFELLKVFDCVAMDNETMD